MAATSDTLEIIVRMKDTASRGLRGVGQALGALRGRVGSLLGSLTSLKGMLATGIGGIGAGLLARSFVKAADTAEQYRTRLNVLLGSQQEGNRAFKEMSDYAATVSYSYEEIMGSATTLAGVMEGGVDEIKKWIPMIADLAAVSGVSVQEATGQIVRMYSAGAGAADLFRDRGILAMLGFQAKTEYTADATRKKLIEAFEDPASKFRGVSKDLAKTWSGMLSMMGDRWFQFRNLVMDEGGVFDYMKLMLDNLLGVGDKLQKEGKLKKWAVDLGNTIVNVMETIIQYAAYLGDAWRGWKMIWQGLKMAFAALGRAFTYVMRGIIAMVQAVYNAYTKVLQLQAKLGEAVEDLGRKLEAAARKIPTGLGDKVEEIGKGIAAFGAAFTADTNVAVNNLKRMVAELENTKTGTKELDGWFNEILDSSLKELEALAAEEPYYKRAAAFLADMRKQWEAIRKEREKAAAAPSPGPRKPPKKTDLALEAALTEEATTKALAKNKTAQTQLEADWGQHIITMEEYYAQRRVLLEKEYELQKALLTGELALEADAKKKAGIRGKIAQLDEQWAQVEIKLNADKAKSVEDYARAEKEASQVVQDIRNRTQQAAAGEDLGKQQELETSLLLQKQQAEIDALLQMKKDGYDVEEQLNDAKNAHILEQEQLAANQKKQIWETYIGSISSVLGDMTSMFLDWYKASGEKSKEMFNVFKAASIAQAIIATYESATKAYNSMVGIPIVGPTLATTAAAVAIAAGLAKVQMIRQQQMARGGLVRGVSPHARADNIDIKATAGEFMQPVSTVKYYGRRGMEAIRKMLVPPEVIQAFAQPSFAVPRGARLAEGGIAASMAGAGAGAGQSLSMQTHITLPENLSFIGRRLEAELEPVILRVIQEELSY